MLSIVAIIMSGLSLAISVIALGWSIYREVGLRPRLLVRLDRVWLSAPDEELGIPEGLYLILRATNFGPGEIVIQSGLCQFQTGEDLRFATQPMPQRIQPGHQIRIALAADEDNAVEYERQALRRMYVLDSFGRRHRVSLTALGTHLRMIRLRNIQGCESHSLARLTSSPKP